LKVDEHDRGLVRLRADQSANLHGADDISAHHLAEALQFRPTH
jgi:hypothetical protein